MHDVYVECRSSNTLVEEVRTIPRPSPCCRPFLVPSSPPSGANPHNRLVPGLSTSCLISASTRGFGRTTRVSATFSPTGRFTTATTPRETCLCGPSASTYLKPKSRQRTPRSSTQTSPTCLGLTSGNGTGSGGPSTACKTSTARFSAGRCPWWGAPPTTRRRCGRLPAKRRTTHPGTGGASTSKAASTRTACGP